MVQDNSPDKQVSLERCQTHAALMKEERSPYGQSIGAGGQSGKRALQGSLKAGTEVLLPALAKASGLSSRVPICFLPDQ